MRGDLHEARRLLAQRIELARELANLAAIGAGSSS
jgi:hypothetical protein